MTDERLAIVTIDQTAATLHNEFGSCVVSGCRAEALRAYIRDLEARVMQRIEETERVMAVNRTIRDSLAAAEKDAARYRKMRELAEQEGEGGGETLWAFWTPTATTLDAAIDAAIAEGS